MFCVHIVYVFFFFYPSLHFAAVSLEILTGRARETDRSQVFTSFVIQPLNEGMTTVPKHWERERGRERERKYERERE